MAMAQHRVLGVHNVGLLSDRSVPAVPPKPADAVARLVCMADTHQQEATWTFSPFPSDADVLVYAGDFTYTGAPDAIRAFAAWLRALPVAEKVVIAGNHDVTLDAPYYDRAWKRFHRRGKLELTPADVDELRASCSAFLCNGEAVVHGLRFWGSPYSPEFCDWAFPLEFHERAPLWKTIPAGVDVVVTHGPCTGHGSLCTSGDEAGDDVLLRELLQRVRPALHVAGHIHEGYGASKEGDVTFVNASSVDLRYKPVHRPIVVDIGRAR